MTEKRFIILDSSISGRYIKDKEHRFDEPMNLREVCNLLNEFNDENKRLTNKLNQTALELVGEVISQGKAVEISEMNYNEFLNYRAKNGKPMELQL